MLSSILSLGLDFSLPAEAILIPLTLSSVENVRVALNAMFYVTSF